MVDDKELYHDFPIIGSTPQGLLVPLPIAPEEISFSGQRQKYCVCFIDMINSTNITSILNDVQISKYYSIFLNAIATIAINYCAKIIKNAGDCLIYYFPTTSDLNDKAAFSDVLECSSIMIEAHRFINAKMNEERLPPLNYRISAEYGMVEIARSVSSSNDDFFGSTMNRCAKINSKANQNSLVIGNDLYQILKSFPSLDTTYQFEHNCMYSAGDEQKYPVYNVKNKQKRIILNPFKCFSLKNQSHILFDTKG